MVEVIVASKDFVVGVFLLFVCLFVFLVDYHGTT